LTVPMTRAWKIFLLFRLPLAVLVLALLVEAGALLLAESPKLRHPLDRLVANMDRVSANADVILLGDSVTQDVVGHYDITASNSVANLTTNQASGMIGAYFLLRRYMQKNKPPRRLVIASTPEFFAYSPVSPTIEIYLASVFRTEAERADLKTAGIPLKARRWKPAILDIEGRIFDRLLGWLFAKATTVGPALSPLAADPNLEGVGGNEIAPMKLRGRRDTVLELSQDALFAVDRICALSRQYKFPVQFVWAPVPESVYRSWAADGRLNRLTRSLRSVVEPNCHGAVFADVNRDRSFPDYAFRDPDHLRRPGWATLYGLILRNMLATSSR